MLELCECQCVERETNESHGESPGCNLIAHDARVEPDARIRNTTACEVRTEQLRTVRTCVRAVHCAVPPNHVRCKLLVARVRKYFLYAEKPVESYRCSIDWQDARSLSLLLIARAIRGGERLSRFATVARAHGHGGWCMLPPWGLGRWAPLRAGGAHLNEKCRSVTSTSHLWVWISSHALPVS